MTGSAPEMTLREAIALVEEVRRKDGILFLTSDDDTAWPENTSPAAQEAQAFALILEAAKQSQYAPQPTHPDAWPGATPPVSL